jgi:ribonuclease T2
MASRGTLQASTVLAALLCLVATTAADAQRSFFSRSPPRPEYRAGSFDYYAVVLAWSPTYCASLRSDDYEPQCHGEGRRFAFLLHGLWPQYERGYPEYCRTPQRPFVPRAVIQGMLDIMPSPRLVIHEYRRHGTCTALGPAAYYDLARRLYGKINIPPRYVDPKDAFFIAPKELVQEFVAVNPGLQSNMISVECRGSGGRLREVRVCFSREGEFRECGDNEDQRQLCRAERMYVPPVRPYERRRGSGPNSGPSNRPPGQRAL